MTLPEAIYVRHAVPALLKYFEEIYPDLVVYCPHLCACAHLAARCLKIRSVSLLTLEVFKLVCCCLAGLPRRREVGLGRGQ